MVNMDYIKFENTYKALMECSDHITDCRETSSKSEVMYAQKLYELCKQFVDECDENGIYDDEGDYIKFKEFND